jgi:glycerol-3-phosphate acyltransferase PlsY
VGLFGRLRPAPKPEKAHRPHATSLGIRLTRLSESFPMARMMLETLLILGGYLFGSISSAIITCRVLGLPDPRSQGSGNPGATNVLRIGGKKAAAVTLLGDMLKGLIPVLVAKLLGADMAIQAATAVAAFLGHLYPVFFGFQGGKVVATLLGVLLGIYWPVGVLTIATWLVIAKVFNISSLAALLSILVTPLYIWWLIPDTTLIIAMLLMGALLFWRHRSNIRNLLEGTEGKIKSE